jgi:hypothetical protein
VGASKKALDSPMTDEVRQAQGRLEVMAQKIGEAMYAEASRADESKD